MAKNKTISQNQFVSNFQPLPGITSPGSPRLQLQKLQPSSEFVATDVPSEGIISHPTPTSQKFIKTNHTDMGVFPKIRENPQIIHFNRVFHYKPSILWAHPYFLETPTCRLHV